jgi:phenylalanyl-tRNA synthetase alpha chain
MLDAAAIATLGEAFSSELAAASSLPELQALKDRYLGRKGGLVTGLYAGLGTAPPEVRRELGRLANELKSRVEADLEARRTALESRAPTAPRVDLTLPGRVPAL